MLISDPAYATLLSNRNFYLPWTDGDNNYSDGVEFGKSLAAATHLPLQVAVTTLRDIPDELARLPHVTERSRGTLRTPRVVLLLHPTYKLLSQALPSTSSYVVAVEFHADPLGGWAALAGAANLATLETMSDYRSAEARVIYERIEFNGNNGWSDGPGKRDAIYDLEQLRALGELDKDALLGYMLTRKTYTAVQHLDKIIRMVQAPAGRNSLTSI